MVRPKAFFTTQNEQMNGQRLFDEVLELSRDRPQLARMGQAARGLAHPEAAMRAANVLEEVAGRRPLI